MRMHPLFSFVFNRWFIGIFLLAAIVTPVWSNEVAVENVQIQANEEGYSLSADFLFTLNPQLESAVNRGIPLFFVVEFELTRPRWYWADEKIQKKTRGYRLSYHSLTRQYRLGSDGLYQSFASLKSALQVLSRLRHWSISETKAVEASITYEAALRFRFDVAQLPRAFQIGSLGDKDWQLSSLWKKWEFTPKTIINRSTAADDVPLDNAPENSVPQDKVPMPSEDADNFTGGGIGRNVESENAPSGTATLRPPSKVLP